MRDGVTGIKSISPRVTTRTSVTVGAAKAFTKVEGVAPAFGEAYGWDVRPGRNFAEDADEAVIGRSLADQLFGRGVDPTARRSRRVASPSSSSV